MLLHVSCSRLINTNLNSRLFSFKIWSFHYALYKLAHAVTKYQGILHVGAVEGH